MNRRRFLQATAASAATLALSRNSFAADNPDLTAIQKEIEKRHDESVQRLAAMDPPALDCRREAWHG